MAGNDTQVDLRRLSDAASLLDLRSCIGPLGDMTKEPYVPQTFDHALLTPARDELHHGLRVGAFKENHDVARRLFLRIQQLQRTRNERDRQRRARKVCTRERCSGSTPC